MPGGPVIRAGGEGTVRVRSMIGERLMTGDQCTARSSETGSDFDWCVTPVGGALLGGGGAASSGVMGEGALSTVCGHCPGEGRSSSLSAASAPSNWGSATHSMSAEESTGAGEVCPPDGLCIWDSGVFCLSARCSPPSLIVSDAGEGGKVCKTPVETRFG